MKLVSVAEMKEIESLADAGGHSYARMMELAGEGLAREVIEAYGVLPDRSVLGLVGSGNNGGDTLVALSYLAQDGWQARAYLAKPRHDDPLVARLIDAGGEVLTVEKDVKHARLATWLENHAVLLDGLLGTGLSLPVRGDIAKLLTFLHAALMGMSPRPHIVAVDCPSGVDTDSGETAADSLPADMTVTMAAVKTGLLRFPAFELVGRLRVVDIGLPKDLPPWEAVQRQVAEAALVRSFLPARPLDAHKGTFGTALVVAGSVNFTGAALLAGEAAYRVGAGLVTLAVPGPLHSALAGHLPEATWLLLPHEMGVISEKAADLIRENLSRTTALVLGPGFGLEDSTRGFMAQLVGSSPKPARKTGIGFISAQQELGEPERAELPPVIVDADGLKLLAQIPNWADHLPSPAVLTPHPGEMAVLTGLTVEEIQSDRMGMTERFAREWGHVVVLKGALTVVAAPDGPTTVIPIATPALARAGSGDVLTGLIGGLRAQGVAAYPAAVAGAWLHARAGLLAAEYLGNTASVLASDVLAAVIDGLAEIER